jgi:hypothetical protein
MKCVHKIIWISEAHRYRLGTVSLRDEASDAVFIIFFYSKLNMYSDNEFRRDHADTDAALKWLHE